MKILNINNHKKINKYIKLFYISKDNPGIIYWKKNGIIIINLIKNLIRQELKKYKYKEVQTAHLIPKKNWKISGHWKNYKKYIYICKKKKKLCIKPMNCLGHIEIFKQKIQSYKNLPIKISEFGLCHRNEPSGSLQGLMRTKSFTQDDAHIFCNKKKINIEIINCIKIIKKIYKIFKFKKIYTFVSTKPKKYLGNKKKWKKIQKKIFKILKNKKIKFILKKNEGAFYGPKIEFSLKDKLNRKWQCGTIQIDFNLSNNLNINFINKNNKKEKPIIIHRAILGSLERFIGILIEQKNGWLPIWLTPIQIIVINISKKNIKYSKKILKKFNKYNYIRAKGNFENKKINFKIRKYTLQKIPYMVICGDKEMISNKINIKFTYKNVNKIKNIKYLINKIKNKTKHIFKGENY